jgi:hypothetical protein
MPSKLRSDEYRHELGNIHSNPITRGIVERVDQWIWSSYRYYEYDDDSVITMDWDGSRPIVSSIRPPPLLRKDGAPPFRSVNLQPSNRAFLVALR